MASPWTAIVPFKGSVAAKSRLHALYGVDGEDWARAFLADIIESLRATTEIGRILVISRDPEISAHFEGVETIPDRSEGLNEAISLGVEATSGPTIVIPADLATLDPEDLSALLEKALSIPFGFVRDAAGDGTALLFANSADLLMPRFGRDSAAAHLAVGADEVIAPITLRLDIDDSISLVAASGGLGIRAKRLLALAKNFPSNE